MLSLPTQLRVYLCIAPTDLRKGFDGLSAAVQMVFARDVLDGHLFLFLNRRRDRIKALFWDRDGLVLWYKKLETEDTQIFGFTEIGRLAHNRPVGLAEAGRMVGISRKSGSRRSIMSGQGSLSVPPLPCGKGSRSARPALDAASTGKAAAGAAHSGLRRCSANRAASRKGGGR